MIPILAWRNIWRNPTRSFVVIGAIALGIWAALFMTGFATGMVNSYISNAIENVVSHVQIHHPEFEKDNEVKFIIPDINHIVASIENKEETQALSIRSLSSGMLSSSSGARGIMIKAVDPKQEARVTKLDTKVIDGSYFEGKRKNQILVSKRLADKLKVKLRSKVVLTFQTMDGEITAGAFRIVGLFNTGTKPFDESHVFLNRSDLNRLLGNPSISNSISEGFAHEIAILLKDRSTAIAFTNTLKDTYPELLIEHYKEISPDLQLYEGQMQYVSIIYLGIIMLALVFGIINTMLMAVLERIRELGMLMAIGMNKFRVFSMIVLETIFLGLVGLPLGLLLGHLTIQYFGTKGLDLSAYSESLQQYGMSELVFFDLDPIVYWQVPISVTITAILASIYPAIKAIRLRPVEAIRKI